jgi:NADPH:quinone reductase-like Zn-dependent oxidoreductase
MSSTTARRTSPLGKRYLRTIRVDNALSVSEDLFDVVASGAVKIRVHARMPLAEASEEHRNLEARQTAGATILLPQNRRTSPYLTLSTKPEELGDNRFCIPP